MATKTKTPELYIIKSKTYKGFYHRKSRDVYAERYLAKGKRTIIQMNSINFDRTKLLIFKDKAIADTMCKIANDTLKKLDIYGDRGSIKLEDYQVIKYKPKKAIHINELIPTPLIGGTAYTIS